MAAPSSQTNPKSSFLHPFSRKRTMSHPHGGCYIAIPTPFRANGEIDHDTLARHADWTVANGVDGIVVCGTTGESATMSRDERLAAMRTVRSAVGSRARIVGGIGTNDTADAVEQVRFFGAEAPVDALMVVVPFYNKPPQAGLVAHFTQAAEASPLPVIAYNVPSRSAVGLTLASMLAVAALPNILGFKEASADLLTDSFLIAEAGHKLLLSGDDATTLPFMAIGGHGVISVVGNMAPAWMSALCDAMAAGDLATAQALQPKIAALHQLMFKQASPAPLKAALEWLGFESQHLRLPLMPLTPAEKSELFANLEALGVPR
jgi:4-hydroxy-tetrahydrodipicolinate synthase